MIKILPLIILFIMSTLSTSSQTNYHESQVPSYELPELLVTVDGESIHAAEEWRQKRRPELIKLFENHVYGKVPLVNLEVHYQRELLDTQALDGKVIMKEVQITFTKEEKNLDLNLLIFLPTNAQDPVPLFLGMNFFGNHTVNPHPGITLTTQWVNNSEALHITDHKATADSRGGRASRWPVEHILQQGYGLATFYYGDIDPDFDDGFLNGIHGLMDTPRSGEAWGSIAAWAWGLSQVMDYLQSDEAINKDKIILLGHSRLGKAGLWAGAKDERFALVISNESGCGGAALSRRKFGERIANINGSFPHWFCTNFRKYNDQEDDLPVDQHQLLALMAPRPLYVASAQEDQWADPTGEYLALYHAGAAYKLYGTETFPSTSPPAVDTPITAGKLAYHRRSGPHDLTAYDWEQFLDFADKMWENDE